MKMEEESSQRTWRARSASTIVVVGLAAVAACLIALMWVQAPPAQGKPPPKDPPTTNTPDEPSFVVNCDFHHRNNDDPIVFPGQHAPTITDLRPPSGSELRDRTPLIAATVRDAEGDLANTNIKLFVDGDRKTTFSYDRSADRLTYTSGQLSFGRHTVIDSCQ